MSVRRRVKVCGGNDTARGAETQQIAVTEGED